MPTLLRWALLCGALGAAGFWGAPRVLSNPDVSGWLKSTWPDGLAGTTDLLPGKDSKKSGPINKCIHQGRTTYTDAPCPKGASTKAVTNERLSVVPAIVEPTADAQGIPVDQKSTQSAVTPLKEGGSGVPDNPLAVGQDLLKKAAGVQGLMDDRAKAVGEGIDRAGQ